MGYFENLGIGKEAAIREISNLENEASKIYFELVDFFEKIEFSKWDGKWDEKINELYKMKGVTGSYCESAWCNNRSEEEWDCIKRNWEVFVGGLSKENITDLDNIINLVEACRRGDLEWTYRIPLDEHRLIGKTLRPYGGYIEKIKIKKQEFEKRFPEDYKNFFHRI